MSTLGERLVQARKFRGYKTQDALAAATENVVTRNAIANIESGRNNAQAPVVDLLCRTLQISKEWLVNGDGQMSVSQESDIYNELCKKYGKLTDNQRLIINDLIDSMLRHSFDEK